MLRLHAVARRIRSLLLVPGFALALLAGCATAPDPGSPEAVAEFQRLNDPIEPFNRAVFAFNQAIDKAIIKPLATLYRDYMPRVVQEAVTNVLANLRTPVVLANDVLQGNPERAGNTLGRFFVNTTVGLGGIADVAAEMGVARHAEDFGQTLAVWGAGEGPYLVLPIFGPSNPRDLTGLVADFFTDPLNWYAANTGREWITFAHAGTTAMDSRSRHMKALDDLERTSLDYYAAIRSLYRQRRADEIRNGRGASDMPSPGLSENGTPATAKPAPQLSQAEGPPPVSQSESMSQ